MDLEPAIARGMEQLDIAVSANAVAQLAVFIALLARWNRAYNLTAVRRPEEMVGRHILDSLSILPWLQGPRILDLGSGAGLPGIPLAIVRPGEDFWLLDSSGKRTRFLHQAVIELGLAHVEVVRSRVEDYHPQQPFDTVMSRAFGSLAEIVRLAGRLCAPRGRLLAMKGTRPEAELAALPSGFEVVDVHRLVVPGLDGERHLVHLVPVGRMVGG